jgi:hypothetical protein
MLLFVRKSAPNKVVVNAAVEHKCFMLFIFLSSSNNCIAQRTTISFAMHDPASVVTLRLFDTGQGLQCLGRHLRDIKVTVDLGRRVP